MLNVKNMFQEEITIYIKIYSMQTVQKYIIYYLWAYTQSKRVKPSWARESLKSR